MNETYPFKLKPLPYSYNAMEPYIDEKTMMIHHKGHLGTYVNNLNKALEKYPIYHNCTLTDLLYNIELLPYEIRKDVRNNGGGVFNHNLYFEGLKNVGDGNVPIGKLKSKIEEQFISFDNFYNLLSKASKELFGSGFVWLTLNKYNNLELVATKNQDTVLELGLCPIILIDLWEHAYYLKYNNKKDEYIQNYKNIIEWNKAEERYLKCINKN